jgi:5-methyltetrahydropteroyltriglutamate--homocysteine methyltransferase
MLTAYFGNLSENAALLARSPFEGLHVDLLDCLRPDRLFSSLNHDKVLSLGLIDGRNIWKNDLDTSLKFIRDVHDTYHFQDLIISPSCSMLHIPQNLEKEKDLPESVSSRLAFAKQKLQELVDLKAAVNDNFTLPAQLRAAQPAQNNDPHASSSTMEQYPLHRKSPFEKRKVIQQKTLQLPLLPTTTIGSFPQTSEIRKMRSLLQKGEITAAEYRFRLKKEIEKTIRFQEKIGLDVLVHGEFERNDMVQYFAEKLDGLPSSRTAGCNLSDRAACAHPSFTETSAALLP